MTAAAAPHRVGIVEDDARYRAGLLALLHHAPDFVCAAVHGSAVEALEALEREGEPAPLAACDLVLMDLGLPGMGGIEATRRLKRLRPGVRVVVCTVFEDPDRILAAICAGADGYLLKRTPPAEMLDQLRTVFAGGAPLTSGVAATVLRLLRDPADRAQAPAGEAPSLTERERDVLRSLVRGLAYKQVADELGLSIDTVRTHIRGIYRKLQVHSVAEAVSRAIREKLA
jgi:two-component system, NarL family, nitrate/nitrite response regulator NarL